MLSNVLPSETEFLAFIPNLVALIIVLEVNVLSDPPVLTSMPFDVAFMMLSAIDLSIIKSKVRMWLKDIA